MRFGRLGRGFGKLGGPVGAGDGAVDGLLLDDISATVIGAYSFRKLKAAYAGSAVRIRRASDNAEADIGFSGNNFDTAAAAAHIGASTGTIVTFYDQSGNSNNLTQGTDASEPTYAAAGLNSLPTMVFDGTDDYLDKTSLAFTSGAQAAFSAVFKFAATADDNERVFSYLADGDSNDFNNAGSAAAMMLHTSALNSFRLGTFGSNSAISLDTAVTGLSHYDGANHTMYVNNVGGTADTDSSNFGTPGTLRIGDTAHALATAPLEGSISELLVITGTLSSGDRTTIHTDQDAYWL